MMDRWQDVGCVPDETEVELLLDDGRVVTGEWWPAPSVEFADMMAPGGWAISIDQFPPDPPIGHPVKWRALQLAIDGGEW